MTLTVDRPKAKANTTIQRCLLRMTLRQQRSGLALLAAVLLVPSLAVLHWLRTSEYALTQLAPALYGNGFSASYWDNHWDHIGTFDSGLFDLVYVTVFACLWLLIPATSMIRRDLAVRLNITLWTQGASPTQWLLAKVAVLAAFVVVCFGTMATLDWALLRWAVSRQLLVENTHDALLLRGVGPSMVAVPLMFVCLGALFAVIPGNILTRTLIRLGLLVGLGGLSYLAGDLFSDTAAVSRTLVTHRVSGVNRSHAVLTGISTTGYWGHQLMTCAGELAIAAGALLLALRLLRRCTADGAG